MQDKPGIVTFSSGGRSGFGLLRGDGIIDLSARHGDRWPDLMALIEAGALREAVDLGMAVPSADMARDAVDLTPPVPLPARILCVGVNYPARAEEYKDGAASPGWPSLFIRFPESFVGHGQPLLRPAVSEQFDYEGEIVMVLGKGGRYIPESEALDHIAALTLCNEGSVRDWMRHAKFNVTQGKNFDCSGAIGPCLIPYEDPSQIADIRLVTRVNGEVRQEDRTSRMLFGFARLINYISTFMTLKPGDVISTGTPTGAGARFDPPIWLQPGDVVEVEADGIGTLSNVVADEKPR